MSAPKRRLLLAVLAASVLAVTATGCAGTSGYPVFDVEQTADDELPDDLGIELDEFDTATSRYAGSHEGVDYFLVKREDNETGGAPCLVVAAQKPDASIIGCSGGDGRVSVTPGAGGAQAMLAPAGEAVGEATGWTRVGDYVAVRDAD